MVSQGSFWLGCASGNSFHCRSRVQGFPFSQGLPSVCTQSPKLVHKVHQRESVLSFTLSFPRGSRFFPSLHSAHAVNRLPAGSAPGSYSILNFFRLHPTPHLPDTTIHRSSSGLSWGDLVYLCSQFPSAPAKLWLQIVSDCLSQAIPDLPSLPAPGKSWGHISGLLPYLLTLITSQRSSCVSSCVSAV